MDDLHPLFPFYDLPWASHRLYSFGWVLWAGLSFMAVAFGLGNGEYLAIIPLVLVAYVISWSFTHVGYASAVGSLWLGRFNVRKAKAIIAQREAVHMAQGREIAGRDL